MSPIDVHTQGARAPHRRGRAATSRILSSYVFRSLNANGFSLLSTTVIQLAAMPLYLAGFGKGQYGEWLVLTALPAMLIMVDLGLAGTATTIATHHYARHEFAESRRVLSGAWMLVSAISVTVAVMAVSVILTRRPTEFLRLTSIDELRSRTILVLSVVQVAVAVQAAFIEGAFRAIGRYPEGIIKISLARLVTSGAGFTTAATSHSPVATAFALCVCQLLVTGWLFITLRRASAGECLLRACVPSKDLIGQLGRPSLALLAFPLGNAAVTQLLVVATSTRLGVGAVVELTAVRTASAAVRQVTAVFTGGLLPSITHAVALRDATRAHRLLRASQLLSLGATVSLGSALIAISPQLFAFWTSNSVVPPRALTALMVLTVVADVPYLASSVLIVAANRQQTIAYWFLAGVAGSLVAAWYLMPSLGVLAVPIGLFFVDLLVTPAVMISCKKILRTLRSRVAVHPL